MSKAIITEQHLNDIADAIIAKGGATAPMTPAQMPAAIAAIPSGGVDPDDPEAFVPPDDWPNLYRVLKEDDAAGIDPSLNRKIAFLIAPSVQSLSWNFAKAWKTSEGETVNSTLLEKTYAPGSYHWVIAYSDGDITVNNTEIPTVRTSALWICGADPAKLKSGGLGWSNIFSENVTAVIDCPFDMKYFRYEYALKYVRGGKNENAITSRTIGDGNVWQQLFVLQRMPINDNFFIHNSRQTDSKSLFAGCHSLKRLPNMIDLHQYLTGSPFTDLYSLEAYPRRLKANLSFGFVTSKRILVRSSFAVIENGVCPNTENATSDSYGLVNNINTCTNGTQTITVDVQTKNLFTADEWTAIANCLSAKNWNLSPA